MSVSFGGYCSAKIVYFLILKAENFVAILQAQWLNKT